MFQDLEISMILLEYLTQYDVESVLFLLLHTLNASKSSNMSYRVCNKKNTTGDTSGSGSAYSKWAPAFSSGFCWVLSFWKASNINLLLTMLYIHVYHFRPFWLCPFISHNMYVIDMIYLNLKLSDIDVNYTCFNIGQFTLRVFLVEQVL